jgi:hypothetical protein
MKARNEKGSNEWDEGKAPAALRPQPDERKQRNIADGARWKFMRESKEVVNEEPVRLQNARIKEGRKGRKGGAEENMPVI